MSPLRTAFLAELHRQLVTLDCPVHRASLDEAVANALRTAGATVEQDWQPIETAPAANGAPSILGWDGEDYSICWRRSGQWANGWDHTGERYIATTVCPTHWRPLPSGPGSKA